MIEFSVSCFCWALGIILLSLLSGVALGCAITLDGGKWLKEKAGSDEWAAAVIWICFMILLYGFAFKEIGEQYTAAVYGKPIPYSKMDEVFAHGTYAAVFHSVEGTNAAIYWVLVKKDLRVVLLDGAWKKQDGSWPLEVKLTVDYIGGGFPF